MSSLSRILGKRGVGTPPSISRIASLLRKYGTDAHVYMPGPGVPVLGPELVVNGDFSNGTTGWNARAATLSVVNGAVQITATGNNYPGLEQRITGLTVGKTYTISGSTRKGTCTADAALAVSGIGASETTNNSTVFKPSSVTFVATATSHNIGPYIKSASVTAGETMFSGPVSVKEVIGYTNWLNGFQAGNYLESTGNTNAVLDGAVGLVLDAAGSVGAELAVGGDFSSAANWSVQAGLTVSGGALSVNAGGGAITNTAGQSAVIGKTYRLEYEITAFTSGQVKLFMGGQGGVAASAVGKYVSHVVATTTDKPQIYVTSGGTVLTVDNVSVKEVTGIHASQATTANKPTLRRGLVNLQTYSQPTNGQWATSMGGTGTSPVVTYGYATAPDGTQAARVQMDKGAGATLADYSQFVAPNVTTVTGNPYTSFLWMKSNDSNTYTVGIRDGVTNSPCVVTPTWKRFRIANNASGTTMGIGCRLRGTEGSSQTADILVASGAVFAGTINDLQLDAAGGIPLTAAAPASSQYGIGEPIYGPDFGISTASLAGWSANATGTLTTDGTSITLRNNAAAEGHAIFGTTTPGKLYQVSVNITALTNTGAGAAAIIGGVRVQLGAVGGATGVKTVTAVAIDATGIKFGTNTANLNDTLTFNSVSAKEILGYKSLPNSYSWQFDGVNDSLTLPSPLFQMLDDHCVVVAMQRGFGSGGYRGALFPAGNSVTTARAGVIAFDPTGNINAYYTNDAGTFTTPNLGSAAPGESLVASLVMRSGSVKGRKNGGVFSGALSPSGACTLNTAGIGNAQGFSYFDGLLFVAIAIKSTVPDAELKLLEKLLGSIVGVQIA